MKEFIKRILILSALMIITTFIISSIIAEITSEIVFVYELVGLAILICTVQEIIKKVEPKSYSIEMILEYITTIILVLGIGTVFGWFITTNWWMVFVYVTPIYGIAYALEVNLVNKNLGEINRVLEKRGE